MRIAARRQVPSPQEIILMRDQFSSKMSISQPLLTTSKNISATAEKSTESLSL